MNAKAVAIALFGCALFWGTGCGGKQNAPKPDDKNKDEHEHGAGPHGGVIIEFGKYHAEFKPDHEKKEATVWILKGDAKNPMRVKTDKLRLVVSNTDPKIEIDLLPTDKAEDGTASEFKGQNNGFGVKLEYKGTVSAQIDGKPFSGDFEEKP